MNTEQNTVSATFIDRINNTWVEASVTGAASVAALTAHLLRSYPFPTYLQMS